MKISILKKMIWCFVMIFLCRLFLNSLKFSLKAVLFHNGKKLPSVPLFYTNNMKESYKNMKILLEKNPYDIYCWSKCCDLKIIAYWLQIDLQLGYIKFYCILGKWESKYKTNLYIKRNGKGVSHLFMSIKVLCNLHFLIQTKLFYIFFL